MRKLQKKKWEENNSEKLGKLGRIPVNRVGG